ncbi:MAG: hypothetical protein ACKPJK_09175 [Microcystis panniformis]
MKSLSIFALIVSTVFGLSQKARAFDVEACAKNPLTTKPESINLLEPIDQKLLNCVPELSSIADKWRANADRIKSAVGELRIGNNGTSSIDRLEYNLTGNYISLSCSARAAHTWKIKECAVPRMVTTYRTVKECAVPRMVQDCAKWVRTPWGKECVAPFLRQDGCERWVEKRIPSGTRQEGCNRWVEKQVPSGVRQEGCNQWVEEPVSASATCTYNYTFNMLTGESKPVFSCGQGALGEYKLDASAVTAILNGEMPNMGQILTSVSITPPLFSDESRDEYNNVRNDMISRHSGSIVYFSSEAFVNWASVENQGASIIATVLSGGSYGAEFARQVEQRLRTELTYMGTFASQTAIQLGTEQILSMMMGQGSMNLNSFDISVKVVDTPKVIQKCMIQPRRECSPEIQSPRVGFAIIATPTKGPALW